MMSATVISCTKFGLSTVNVWTSAYLRTPALVRTRTAKFSFSITQSKIALKSQNYGKLWNNTRGAFQTFLLLCKRCSGQVAKAEVTRDVLLYKNDKGTFFKVLGAFACAQLVFWSYLTHTAYLTMRDTDTYVKVKYGEEGPPEEVKNWRSWAGVRMQLSSGMWRYGITLLSIGAGSIIFVCSLLYSRRSIYRIVLRKGGQDVTIQTYGLFGLPWRFTTSLHNVSCEHSRQGIRTQLPIKVRGHRLFYILDKDGKFYNARLFDFSVGVHRML